MKETYSRTKSVWQRMDADERQAVMDYGEKYKAFLDVARTERLAADEIIRQAEAAGFKPVYDMDSLKPGDKVYWNQKGKSVILAVDRGRTGACRHQDRRFPHRLSAPRPQGQSGA